MEVWKLIEGYPGYEISSEGRVISRMRLNPIYREILWRPVELKTKTVYYAYVNLYKGKVAKNELLSRLLAIAFIPNPDNLPEVDHIDQNSENNTLSNLRWVSASQNKINRTTKIGPSNERHIRIQNNKASPYGVTITRDKKTVYCKWFKTLEEAIFARDSFLDSL